MRGSDLDDSFHPLKSLTDCEDLCFSRLDLNLNNTINTNDIVGTKLTTRQSRYPERVRKTPDRSTLVHFLKKKNLLVIIIMLN